ncbi:MAG: hypothetical protein AAF265_00075 [Pseudomonadota bacterium]
MISRWFGVAVHSGMLPVLAAIALAGLLVVWLGARRLRGRALWLWWPVQLAAVLGVLAILVPPPIAVSSREGVLITAGASSPQSTDNAWITPAALLRLGSTREPIASLRLRQLGTALPEAVVIEGHGLTADEWFELRGASELALAIEPPQTSIAILDAPSEVLAGRSSLLRVTVSGPSESMRIELRRAGAEVSLAEAEIRAGVTEITIPPLVSGRHAFAVRLVREDTEIQKVRFGVQARVSGQLSVLALQDSASFEWRYLVDWLADTGAAVSARARVSSDRFVTRFLNRTESSADLSSWEAIAAHDLVILDGASLAALDSDTRARVLQPGSGPGVLVLVHDVEDLAALEFVTGIAAVTPEQPLIYQMQETIDNLDSGLVRLDVRFDSESWSVRRQDLSGLPVVAERPAQRLAVATIADSYRIHGAVSPERYARLWAEILDNLPRPIRTLSVDTFPSHSAVYERQRVCASGASDFAAVIVHPTGTRGQLDLAPLPLRPGESCAWFWPTKPGWYRFIVDEAFADRFFVPSNEVASRRASDAFSVTSRITTGNGERASPVVSVEPMSRLRLLPWVLLLALLAWWTQRSLFAPRHTAV